MAQIDDMHESRRGLAMSAAIAGAIGALLWRLVRLPVYSILVLCEPVLRVGFTTLALLGLLTAVVLEFSGSAPRFPFWGAMLFFSCCGVLPLVYRAALRLFAP
jgi:hypothetical protein